MLWKNHFEKISKFVKKPHWQPSFFSFVCGHEPDSRAPLPFPPPLQTHQASFLQVIWCPCCVESNRALRRRKPVWQAPKTSSLSKNAGFKCRLCFRCLPHLIVMKYIVGYDLNFCVTKNNASVAFKINLFSSAIFHQCLELKSNENNL